MGPLEWLRDARTVGDSDEGLLLRLRAWYAAGCPGYESEAVATIQGLEVKHFARVITTTDMDAPVLQMEPGGPLILMCRGTDGVYRLHKIPMVEEFPDPGKAKEVSNATP